MGTRNTNQRTPKGSTATQAIIVKIDPKKHRNLRIYCAKHGVPMSSLIRNFIDSLIE